jgi:heptaprenylglyceryl phosphate synthase
MDEKRVINHNLSFTQFCNDNEYILRKVAQDGHCFIWAILNSNDGNYIC